MSNHFDIRAKHQPWFLRLLAGRLFAWCMAGILVGFLFHGECRALPPTPIFGFADLHNHQFANLGFGGGMLVGWPYGDMESSLPWCTDRHGPGGMLDPFTIFTNMYVDLDPFTRDDSGGHLVGGWPQFDGWPRWNSLTHQQVYYEWLKRAFDGGLKLMVMPAVSNKTLCEVFYLPEPGFTCNDMDAVDLQIAFAYDLQNFIDSQSGGPGTGWYRIVTSAAEARQVMSNGKMAVVLGIEVDTLFNCGTHSGCTSDYVAGELDRYYRMGVRHIFPVHLMNNGFGGAALYEDMFNAMNRRETGEFFQANVCSPVYEFQLSPGAINASSFLNLITNGAVPPPYYGNGHCNVLGLSPGLGTGLIDMLMDRRMIIDIDHLSRIAVDQTLNLAEQREYPVVSGHTGLLGISLGAKRSEAQKSDTVLERIRNLGGLVATILHQGDTDEIAQPLGSPVAHDCGNSSRSWVQAYLYAVQKMGGPVAIGSDFNGGVKQPAPRFGPEACGTHSIYPPWQDPGAQVLYPFVTETGVLMNKSRIGGRNNPYVPPRVFDINVDGLAHVGMLPDFIADVKELGLSSQDLAPLFGSAEAYVRLWEKIEAANLRVESLSNPPSTLEAGWSFNVTDRTSNFGASATPAVSITRFYLSADDLFSNDDSLVGERSVPIVYSGGASVAVTPVLIPQNIPAGTYYLLACADATGTVPESRENDNCREAFGKIRITPFTQRQCYTDNDHDGYVGYAPDYDSRYCIAQFGFDCNDDDLSIHPGAIEFYCDGKDNDCDGTVDDNVVNPYTFYRDYDGDGYGDPTKPLQGCQPPKGYVGNNTDCNDKSSSIYPGATEICGNEVDDNCDGIIDEGTFYRDRDGDGYGDRKDSTVACTQPAGFILNDSDCDDGRASIHPGALEICDGRDNDCDGLVDEGFDADGDGWTICAGDCDDHAPAVSPGAPELCDGLDNNCNGVTDEGLLLTFYQDADGDGYGNPNTAQSACSQPAGFVADKTDCNDKDPGVHPGVMETCGNKIDDNCNGEVDEETLYYLDADKDGYGDPASWKSACTQPEGFILDNADCNDADDSIYPGAKEVCNGNDDNCDGTIDEGFDLDGDGWTSCAGDCNDKDKNVHPGVPEVCDGRDNNCDGRVDEGLLTTYYPDADGDGYGNPDKPVLACSPPAGYVKFSTDCNDGNKLANPGAPEICGNDIDDNCNGRIDEGTGQDNDVDGLDLAGLAAAIGKACIKDGLCPYDLNADGLVDKSDLALFASYFGTVDRPGPFPICSKQF